MQIINDNNFVQLNKYYDLYNNMDRRQLENVVVRNMILKDKRFDSIRRQQPEDLYNRLRNGKRRVKEEDKKIRINMVRKLCIVNNEKEITIFLKGIAPLLRHKKRSILLMGGNYEKVNMETEKAIVSYMSTMPKKSAQTEETSPTIVSVSPPHSFKKPTKTSIPSDSTHITIGSESM